jgi:hypothetical protein
MKHLEERTEEIFNKISACEGLSDGNIKYIKNTIKEQLAAVALDASYDSRVRDEAQQFFLDKAKNK